MITVDTSGVNRLFNTLTSSQLKKVIKSSTREAAKQLTTATKQLFTTTVGSKIANSRNYWNGRTLKSGIKYSSDKQVSYKVHIMGDFRLKFFEMGTKERYTKKGRYRGKMVLKSFFDPTLQRLETKLSEDIKDSITKNLIKYALGR